MYLDANWYYVKDEAERAAREHDEKEYRRLYGVPVDTYCGDDLTDQTFQQTLFLITLTGRVGTGTICPGLDLPTCRLRHG